MTRQRDMLRLDQRPLAPAPREIFCVAWVRNESLRPPHFLAYHRHLGIDRFFIIDNCSCDGSPDYLLAQPGALMSFPPLNGTRRAVTEWTG
jgi:hypothetical protein